MPSERSQEEEIAFLRAELKSISSKTARAEVVAQSLRDTQYRLDLHINKFARMHEYAQRVFSTNDRETLYATIVEGIVDVFQIDVGGLFEVNIADQQLILLSGLNLETDQTVFPISSEEWKQLAGSEQIFSNNQACCESPVTTRIWLDLGLSSVIFMPIFGNNHQINGVVVGGISEANKDVYDFLPQELTSPFMVYCQQMNGIMGLFEAIDKANLAGRAKSRFFANLSHEIRTPMNAIIGMTQIAERTKDPEEINRCIQQIKLSSKHLLGLINDVLDISKIEDGKFKLANNAFDLHQVIESVRVSMQQLANNKSLTLLVDFHHLDNMRLRLLGDDMRLSQVLINLLGNAIKFTPENGQVRLDISEFSHGSDSITLQFSVTDTGIGIAPEFLERMFKPFEQADNTISRNYGGTGLGLTISQHIVGQMGGSIRVESVLGQGARFTFSIRFERDLTSELTQENQPPIEKESSDFSGYRILVADDVKVNRMIIYSLLKETNLIIDEVENGQEAADKVLNASAGYYLLVLMDMQMPVMDGCTATRIIRASQHPDAGTLPIIAMTANVFKEDVQEVLDAGMNGHIGKPVDIQIVLDTIRKTIQQLQATELLPDCRKEENRKSELGISNNSEFTES
ncbi:MAG: response regulator [Planctomycetaceae bacterium]|jgi:CheY-like chemotaxis protein/nitrogen-specific signal transduction histidine kinase|nr:response regulator [Planctomycetaceae bacterium]